MKIGILVTGHMPDELMPAHTDYGVMLAQLLDGQGFEFETFFVVDEEIPESINDADGWLISGSRHGAYEDLPWIPPLEDFIRECVTQSVPIIGVCFGHQIIAQALGGRVEKYADGWAVGPQRYDFGGTEISMMAWHQDQVVENAPGATVLASNEFCKNAALVYGDRALSVQAHPEYGGQFIDGLIRYRGRGLVPDVLLDEAAAQLDTSLNQQTIADQFADFFRQERQK